MPFFRCLSSFPVSPVGAVELALEPVSFCFLLCKLLAKAIEVHLFPTNVGDDRGTNADANNTSSKSIFRLLVGHDLTDELGVKLVVSVYLAPHQVDVLDPAGKSVADYGSFRSMVAAR